MINLIKSQQIYVSMVANTDSSEWPLLTLKRKGQHVRCHSRVQNYSRGLLIL